MQNRYTMYLLGLGLSILVLTGAGCQLPTSKSGPPATSTPNNLATTTPNKTSDRPQVLPSNNTDVSGRECDSDNDCPAGGACNATVGWCLTEGETVQACGSGTKTWPCRENQWCGTAQNECRSTPFCRVSGDCGTNKICVNGYCGPAPTDSTSNPAPSTNNQTNNPTTCTSNSQCVEKGTYCSGGKCIASTAPSTIRECAIGTSSWSCSSDEKCGTKVNACLPTGGNCVYNTDCDNTEFCNHGTCAMKYQAPTTKRCVNYKDCGDIAEWVCANTYCARALPGTKQCQNSSAVWTCSNDNYVCGNTVYECLKTCVESSDCQSGWSCRNGVCAL